MPGADLLVIDDVGLRPLIGEEPVDPYEIIRRRDERALQCGGRS